MARIKIDEPERFIFETQIPVRITDLNYGGHLGNDAVLSLIHETRVQFLEAFGYSEMNLGGVSLIMADVGIEYKNESFYGDVVHAKVGVGDWSRVSFDIYYWLELERNKEKKLMAKAKTGMVCFDYENRKIAEVPLNVKEIFENAKFS